MQIDYQTHELGVSIPWYEYRKTPTRILMIVGQGGSIISSFHKKKVLKKKSHLSSFHEENETW